MTHETVDVPNPSVESLPFNSAGAFWLEPAVLQDVGGLINETRLSSMHLGAMTQTESMAQARQETADILINTQQPFAPEMQRALDIGYVYGRLMAERTASAAEQPFEPTAHTALPAELAQDLQAAMAGRSITNDNDAYLLFMRLRDLEVKHARSDVLAFCSSIAQDHLLQQFVVNHSDEQTELTHSAVIRMQSLFYAGALVGGVLNSSPVQLQKTPVEIMRGQQTTHESFQMRLEFEAGDDLVAAIDHQLSAKLYMRLHQGNGNGYITAQHGGMQFGPNGVGLPLFVKDSYYADICTVPADQVQALIVRETDKGGNEHLTLHTDITELSESSNLAGMILNDSCVGQYDVGHPNAAQLQKLAGQLLGTDAAFVPYANSYQLHFRNTSELRNVSGRKLLIVGLIGEAAFLAAEIPKIVGGTYDRYDALTDTVGGTLVAMLFGSIHYAIKWRKKSDKEFVQIDNELQAILDRETLGDYHQ